MLLLDMLSFGCVEHKTSMLGESSSVVKAVAGAIVADAFWVPLAVRWVHLYLVGTGLIVDWYKAQTRMVLGRYHTHLI